VGVGDGVGVVGDGHPASSTTIATSNSASNLLTFERKNLMRTPPENLS
jgi:hypothetical protein